MGFNQHLSQQSTFSSPSQHFLAILLYLLPFTSNLPSMRRPNSCIAVWQQLICWLVLLLSLSTLPTGCPWFTNTGLFVITYIIGSVLCGVSLLTMAAISVDRLLALLSGLKYKEIVTLKSVYIILASFWVLCLVASLCTIFDQRITDLNVSIALPLSLLISLASYTKIFRTLRHHQAQVQQQPSQPNALNMARYRKAVHSALWVQSVLVVCYTPYYIMRIVVTYSTTYSSHLVVTSEMATILVYFNSTLNPFLYCWKISEVRRAMKQTIRQALCCPWS